MAKLQTLDQAVHLAKSGKSKSLSSAACSLLGKPVGGWPETQQAMRELRDELPLRSQREYTVQQFVDAVYITDSADRYRSRLGA